MSKNTMPPTAEAVAPIEENSVISRGMVGRIFNRFEEKCLKHAGSFPRQITQDVLEDEGDALVQEMFEALRKRVENRSSMIVRRVTVDRNRTAQEVVDATNRTQNVNNKALATMPGQGEGTEEVDVHFFKLGSDVSVEQLEREYEERGLVPHYYAQAQVNIDDPSFADNHPNGMQWDVRDGESSYASFRRWRGRREVGVDRRDYGWFGGFWFGGVRKKQPSTA